MTAKLLKSRFSTVLVLLIIAATLPFAASCVGVEQPRTKLDAILNDRLIRVGTTGDFMPFSYRRDGSSQLHGVDIVFAQNMASAMGVNVEFVQTTWPKLMDDLLADKFDVALSGITITPARLKVAFFSRPIMSSGKVAITRKENADRFETIERINQAGVRVIVNPGGTNEAFARENFPQATIIVNAENLTVFEKIISGVADVMVTDAVEAAVQEVVHPNLRVSNWDAPFNTFDFGILLPRDPELKSHIDRWLEGQLEDRTYKSLFAAELTRIESISSGDQL